MKKVWTPSGYHTGPVNSLVGKGESIIDYNNGTGTLVTKGQKGVDNQPSSVKDGDQNVVVGNDIDWSNGIKFSDQAAPLTGKLQMYNEIENRMNRSNDNLSSLSKQTKDLQNKQLQSAKQPILDALKNITDKQQLQHEIEDYNNMPRKYNSGKSSSFYSYTKSSAGKVPNYMIDFGYLAPTILEGKMLNHWMKEQPQMPNIYAANRYAQSALGELNKMRVDPYNQLRKLDSVERAAYYRMQQNGGYTGGQRQAARVALALDNAKQAADILNTTQLQNNQYRSQWANAALQEGNQDAARRQAAAQYGWEAYNRAHGAKTKGIETHLANIGALGQKWLQQRIKNKQYGDILNMYQQDIDNKNAALQALYGNKEQTTNNHSVNSNQSTLYENTKGIAPNWSASGYNPYSYGSPNVKANVPYNGYSARFQPMNLTYGDYKITGMNPQQKYWYVDADKVAKMAEDTRNWGRQQEMVQAAKYGAQSPKITFTSDATGEFGANGLYRPNWAGSYFDYNPLFYPSVTLRQYSKQ